MEACLRMTRVVSRAALTLLSTLLSAPFNICPTHPFSNEHLFLNQFPRCKHWVHPWLMTRRHFDVAVDAIELILVMALVTMLTTWFSAEARSWRIARFKEVIRRRRYAHNSSRGPE